MSALESIRRGLSRGLGAGCALIFAALVLDVLWGVFTRQVLGDQPAWTEEVARFLLVWLALLGGVLAYADDRHLGVDILVGRFDTDSRRLALVFVHLSVLVFALAVLVGGGIDLFASRWNSAQTMATLPLRKAWFYLVVPIAGVLISVLAILKMIATFGPSAGAETTVSPAVAGSAPVEPNPEARS